MAVITENLRAIMAIDPERAEIDFEGRDYSWGDLARVVRAIERRMRTTEFKRVEVPLLPTVVQAAKS